MAWISVTISAVNAIKVGVAPGEYDFKKSNMEIPGRIYGVINQGIFFNRENYIVCSICFF